MDDFIERYERLCSKCLMDIVVKELLGKAKFFLGSDSFSAS
jgi:hypothetical protein